MSKKATIDFLAKETGLSKKDVTAVLDSLPKALQAELKSEGRAVLHNVCSIKVVHKAARTGRNPQTGQPLTIEARDVLKFAAVGELKASV
jgi:DNA-binding protein HU-beta